MLLILTQRASTQELLIQELSFVREQYVWQKGQIVWQKILLGQIVWQKILLGQENYVENSASNYALNSNSF